MTQRLCSRGGASVSLLRASPPALTQIHSARLQALRPAPVASSFPGQHTLLSLPDDAFGGMGCVWAPPWVFLDAVQAAHTLRSAQFVVFSWQRHLQGLRVPSASPVTSSGQSPLFQSRCRRPGRPRGQQPRQVDVGRGVSGDAWLSPCAVHASQNRKGRSKSGIPDQNVTSGAWCDISGRDCPPNNSPKVTSSTFTGEQLCQVPLFTPAWAAPMHSWGDRADGSLFCSVHFTLFSGPVLPALKIFSDFFSYLQIST